jgi:probable HAF family extracellular repeat protein
MHRSLLSAAMNLNLLHKISFVFVPFLFLCIAHLIPLQGVSETQSAPPASAQFTITDLGTLPGGTNSYALSINNLGQVVGHSNSGQNSGTELAFFWDGSMISLGPIFDIYGSWATDINNSSQVVGFAPQSPLPAAFIWDSVAGLQYLGTLPGGTNSGAEGINDLGQVVGYSNSAETEDRAFVWDNTGGMQSLGTLYSTDTQSFAVDINNSGTVVGFSGTEFWRSFIWTSSIGMVDLGLPRGYTSTRAEAINDEGMVVGYVLSGHSESSSRAFLWTNQQGIRLLRMVKDGIGHRAHAINNQGQIVGEGASLEDANQYRALYWFHGQLLDLNTLLPADSGWILRSATGINDLGQIVGTGAYQDQTRAFILSPIQDNASR